MAAHADAKLASPEASAIATRRPGIASALIRRVQRHDQRKRGAEAGLAIGLDPATHQGSEATADSQAQTGAAVGAGSGGVGDFEAREQCIAQRRIDADAGVLHLETPLAAGAGYGHRDA